MARHFKVSEKQLETIEANWMESMDRQDCENVAVDVAWTGQNELTVQTKEGHTLIFTRPIQSS